MRVIPKDTDLDDPSHRVEHPVALRPRKPEDAPSTSHGPHGTADSGSPVGYGLGSCAKRYDKARSRSRRRRFKCFIMRPTASAWSWGPRTGDGPAFGHRPSMSCHVAWREWPALSHQQIGIDWRTCFLTFSLTVRLPEQNCKMTRDGE